MLDGVGGHCSQSRVTEMTRTQLMLHSEKRTTNISFAETNQASCTQWSRKFRTYTSPQLLHEDMKSIIFSFFNSAHSNRCGDDGDDEKFLGNCLGTSQVGQKLFIVCVLVVVFVIRPIDVTSLGLWWILGGRMNGLGVIHCLCGIFIDTKPLGELYCSATVAPRWPIRVSTFFLFFFLLVTWEFRY